MNCPIPIHAHYDLFARVGELDFPNLTAINYGAGTYASDVARQITYMPFKKLVSIDGYEPYRAEALKSSFAAAEHEYLVKRVENMPIEPFDVAFAHDVLEHLTKEDGLAFLDKLDKTARLIVLFLPLEPAGFHRTNPEPLNPLQDHISHWEEGEFLGRGYKTERIANVLSENGRHWDSLWAIKHND